MKHYYEDLKEEAVFQLSDFTCPIENKKMSEDNLYRIIWVLEDNTVFNIDAQDINLNKDQMLFLTPHNKIKFDTASKKLISVSFNKEFYCINTHDKEVSCNGFLFYGSSEVPVISLNEKERNSMYSLFSMLIEEFEYKDAIQGEMLRVLLKRLLIKSSRLSKELLTNPEIKDPQLDVIRKYNVLVEQNFKEKHKVKEYAQLLFKSPKTLSNLFAQYNDKTPLQVINERLILEAKRLLNYSEMGVQEIAYHLGYKDSAHFSKFFKKQTGQSPAFFRKNAA